MDKLKALVILENIYKRTTCLSDLEEQKNSEEYEQLLEFISGKKCLRGFTSHTNCNCE